MAATGGSNLFPMPALFWTVPKPGSGEEFGPYKPIKHSLFRRNAAYSLGV